MVELNPHDDPRWDTWSARGLSDDEMRRAMRHSVVLQPGDRVQLAPYLDLWMRGARYGEVVKVAQYALVKLDATRATVRICLSDLTRV